VRGAFGSEVGFRTVQLDVVTKRVRAGLVRAVDALGQRERVQRWVGRLSPSPRVRRDHRDGRNLRVLVASSLGGGGLGIDVGANVGVVADMMRRASPRVRHVLVEPVHELAERLRTSHPSCEVVEAVCGRTPGEVRFAVAPLQPTRSSLHDSMARAGGEIEHRVVDRTTLDAIVGARRPALVKIDVEGSELDVLAGAKGVLERDRPLVVFEHQRSEAVGADVTADIHCLLTDLGYHVFDIDGAGPLDREAFLRVVEGGRVWNFLAVASERPHSGAS
jgi:FkbM family methyltransferase